MMTPVVHTLSLVVLASCLAAGSDAFSTPPPLKHPAQPSAAEFKRRAPEPLGLFKIFRSAINMGTRPSNMHAEAHTFWTVHFCCPDEQSVTWKNFANALTRDYELAESDFSRIQQEVDANHDGFISLLEFAEFTAKDGLEKSLQIRMHSPTPPSKLSNENVSEVVPWLPEPPKARISTWQSGRDQQTEYKYAGEIKTATFAVFLVALVKDVVTWEGAKAGLQWIQQKKFFYGMISLLNFGGSTMTCFNYRNEAERLTKAGDERLLMLYRTYIGFYSHTMIKCVMLQYGGTTSTGLLLGEPAHWITDTSSITGPCVPRSYLVRQVLVIMR
jgi:hypothetical protein